jgi:hypothetical protein
MVSIVTVFVSWFIRRGKRTSNTLLSFNVAVIYSCYLWWTGASFLFSFFVFFIMHAYCVQVSNLGWVRQSLSHSVRFSLFLTTLPFCLFVCLFVCMLYITIHFILSLLLLLLSFLTYRIYTQSIILLFPIY